MLVADQPLRAPQPQTNKGEVIVTMSRKFLAAAGVVGALLVPALVVAQIGTFFDESESFENGELLSADKLNRLVTLVRAASDAQSTGWSRCRVAVVGGCSSTRCFATCPSGHVVTGGGCAMSPGSTMRIGRPAFDQLNSNGPFNGFPAPLSFDGEDADPIVATESGPEWNRYDCEAASGTVQTVYAVCCPI